MLTDAVAAMLLETDNSDVLPCSRQVPSSSGWDTTQKAMMPGIKLKRKKAGDPAYGGGANSGAKARKKSKSASGPSATIPPSSIVEVQHPTAPPPLYLPPPSSIVEVLHPTAPPPLYLPARSTAYDLSMSTTPYPYLPTPPRTAPPALRLPTPLTEPAPSSFHLTHVPAQAHLNNYYHQWQFVPYAPPRS
ncbi:hypothetical protein B0H14DRAFT_2561023 [Mycena olivaceomarginata]|nr:hypothetical protein B0H14DRAFT_2561023 [Mycena olivaceomarginata]